MWLPSILKNPFSKKKTLVAIFIDETGQVIQTIKPYGDNTFRVATETGEETYVIDPNCVFYDHKKNMPTAFYYSGNPLPIKLAHTREYDFKTAKTIDAKTLSKVIDDKVVSDLFRPAEETINIKLVFWLIVVGLIIQLWLAYRSFYPVT